MQLVRQGQGVVNVYGEANYGNHGSHSILLKVNQGQEVWIQNIVEEHAQYLGGSYSSFSGILLGNFKKSRQAMH